MKNGFVLLKKIAPILLTIMFAFCYQPAESQILKKLKKKVEKSVEDAVIKKTAEKAGKETEKAMDSILNNKGEDKK